MAESEDSATAPGGAEVPDASPDFGWHGASGVNTLPLTVALMEMGARTYVPALGRFLQADPVVNGGANPYAYTNGDPINGHDMTGTTDKWWAPFVGAVAAAVVGAIIGLATAGLGTGVGAAIGWGIVAAALGGAAGEVTTELINTGHVDFKQVGYAVAVDVALAVLSFGTARFYTQKWLRARASRAGSVANSVEGSFIGEAAVVDNGGGLLSGGGRRLSTGSNMLIPERYSDLLILESSSVPSSPKGSFVMPHFDADKLGWLQELVGDAIAEPSLLVV